MFNYIFNGKKQTNTTLAFMQSLGMNEEQVASVLCQKEYEASQYSVKRAAAYKAESDPLYMEAQFDGTVESLQIWKDKVTEIKARYPSPE